MMVMVTARWRETLHTSPSDTKRGYMVGHYSYFEVGDMETRESVYV